MRTDPALRVPDVVRDLLEALVRDGYGDAMFVDRTKVVMATVEARTDVPNEVYLQRQRGFDADLLAGLPRRGPRRPAARRAASRTPTAGPPGASTPR